MNKLYKSGEIPNSLGKYRETGKNGENIQKPRIITNGPKKEKLPPTAKKNRKWIKFK